MTNAAPRRPPGRYGDPAAGRRRAMLGGGALVAVLLAYAAWYAVQQARVPVRWLDVGYRVASDARVDVTFQLTQDPGRRAVCTLRALNVQFAEVGLADVRVGPSTRDTVTVTAPVPTSERAVRGEVKACVPA